MKRTLRITGLLLCLVAGGLWLATGANRGWTKTRVPIRTLDAVTGIEGIEYRRQFVPGVDFLGAAAVAAGGLAAGSFLFRHQPKPT